MAAKELSGKGDGSFPQSRQSGLNSSGGYSPDTNDQPEAIKKKGTLINKYTLFVI